MKKGMNIQFSWIYIIVVGFILIVIAITIIGNIKKNAAYSLTTDIKMYVDNSLRNIQLNHNGMSKINLPDTQIEINCEAFSVGKNDAGGWPLTDIIVFSPKLIRKQILGYSSSFQMPYETEYFTYVTSPEIEYVFEDSDLGKKAFDFFPNNTYKSFEETDNDNFKERRYISFESSFMEDDEVKIIIIDDKELFPSSFGKAEFNDGEGYFFDKNTLIGIMYSKDYETYECNLKKALKKLSMISKLKKDKALEYSSKFSYCPYNKIAELLNEMSFIAGMEKTDMLTMKKVYVLSNSIKQENMLLQRLSCPMIY